MWQALGVPGHRVMFTSNYTSDDDLATGLLGFVCCQCCGQLVDSTKPLPDVDSQPLTKASSSIWMVLALSLVPLIAHSYGCDVVLADISLVDSLVRVRGRCPDTICFRLNPVRLRPSIPACLPCA